MDIKEKEWFIQAPWGKICVVAWGDCFDPPVLLCHGLVDSAANFKPLLKHLPKNYYYIGIELPGNGKSDHFPKGLMLNAYDLVYAVHVVVKHFRWKQFIFVGHSYGTLVGKLYDVSNPGKISKVVELDPRSTYNQVSVARFPQWYDTFFTNYYEKYHVYNAPKEDGPTYSRDKALSMLRDRRGLPEEVARWTLDRISEPISDELVRFTYDQRVKLVTSPPFSKEYMRKIYTNLKTPTLILVATESKSLGFYDTDFALEESSYIHGNVRVKEIEGSHDLHCIIPEKIAPFVSQFLLLGLEGLDSKAKL